MTETTENSTHHESLGKPDIEQSPSERMREIFKNGIEETIEKATFELYKHVEETVAKNNPEMTSTDVREFIDRNLVRTTVEEHAKLLYDNLERPDMPNIVYSPVWKSEQAAAIAVGGDGYRIVNTNRREAMDPEKLDQPYLEGQILAIKSPDEEGKFPQLVGTISRLYYSNAEATQLYRELDPNGPRPVFCTSENSSSGFPIDITPEFAKHLGIKL